MQWIGGNWKSYGVVLPRCMSLQTERATLITVLYLCGRFCIVGAAYVWHHSLHFKVILEFIVAHLFPCVIHFLLIYFHSVFTSVPLVLDGVALLTIPDFVQNSFSVGGDRRLGEICHWFLIFLSMKNPFICRNNVRISTLCAFRRYRPLGPRWASRLDPLNVILPLGLDVSVGSYAGVAAPCTFGRSVARCICCSSGFNEKKIIRRSWLLFCWGVS